jgi:pimeloyl-ACP methyl ester carboxylesterase
MALAQIPLPDDVALTPPAAVVPADIAAFAGAWGVDAWAGILPHVLVVERVGADGEAEVVYAIGQAPEWGIQPEWQRLTFTISGGVLHRTGVTGVQIDYELNSDGRLCGRYVTADGWPVYAELNRISPATPEAIRAAAATPYDAPWEEIWIPERSALLESGAYPITLQASFYRSPLLGPRPLVIFNHGSTDRTMPKAVLRARDEARVFAVAPMRKGRGRSEGSYLVEQGRDWNLQVASGIEDIDAVVTAMRARPDIDANHIVLVGQSRGGFLAALYAGRHPAKVRGVINFAGGWWGDSWIHMDVSEFAAFNTTQFAEAGATAHVPMLWLYGENDSYYSRAHIERNFSTFQERGGCGRLIVFDGIRKDGHALLAWPDKWRAVVADYLAAL